MRNMTTPLIDTKTFGKPPTFTGQDDQFQDWEFIFSNYCAMLDVNLGTLMTSSKSMTTEVDMNNLNSDPTINAQYKAISVTLFRILTQVVKGKALRLLRNTTDNNGLEAWRKIYQEYVPKIPSR